MLHGVQQDHGVLGEGQLDVGVEGEGQRERDIEVRAPGAGHRDRVTLALDASGGRMKVRSRRPLSQVQSCDALAAGPFVYRLGDGEPQLLGEILRNVRGAAAATVQSLAVEGRGEGRVEVRLSEQKPEVTYLDEVFLEVDGVRVEPQACRAAAAPAYCAADGRNHLMGEGDALDLQFVTPPHAAARLVARGYYVPTPTARERAGARI